jgi:hypothetical protein
MEHRFTGAHAQDARGVSQLFADGAKGHALFSFFLLAGHMTPIICDWRSSGYGEGDSNWKRETGIMKVLTAAAIAMMIAFSTVPGRAEDTRELIKLPPMMQEHMLSSMRDHLKALNEILEALSQGDVDKAGTIAEKRLGMSSLALHGAAQLAKFMPEGMRAIGTQMHKSASRFVIAAKNAELSPDREALHETYGALKEVTDNCIACHSAYRLR